MIKALSTFFVGFVALAHTAFFVLEQFYWDHPVGRKIFSMTEAQSSASALLAANQGFYNLMIAIGLFWGLTKNHRNVVEYLLFFVVAVGVYGALTVKLTILFTQAMPALIALILYKKSAKQERQLFS